MSIDLNFKSHVLLLAAAGRSTCLGMHRFCHGAAAAAKSLQSCPTLCDPIGSSPWGSPVPGIPQARTLEWVAMETTTIKTGSCRSV